MSLLAGTMLAETPSRHIGILWTSEMNAVAWIGLTSVSDLETRWPLGNEGLVRRVSGGREENAEWGLSEPPKRKGRGYTPHPVLQFTCLRLQ